jgi:hypothetical protein|tara:strand:- start:98 stop:379 length:282 start_codon:yes stop_codon:yes gene_type:complete
MDREHVRMIVTEQFLAERESQEDKWGEQMHHTDEFWTVILGEEFGEVAREVYEKDTEKLYNELIQCGAVCMAWAEAIQKRNIDRQIEKGEELQ